MAAQYSSQLQLAGDRMISPEKSPDEPGGNLKIPACFVSAFLIFWLATGRKMWIKAKLQVLSNPSPRLLRMVGFRASGRFVWNDQ